MLKTRAAQPLQKTCGYSASKISQAALMLAVLSVITAVTLLTPATAITSLIIFATLSPVSWVSSVDIDLIKTGLFLRFGMDTIKLTRCSFLLFDTPSDINATTFDSAIYSPITVFCFSNALSRRRVASS